MYSVMVVDDERIVRLAIREIIMNGGCGFWVAAEGENGRQALAQYEQQEGIDIVLTDITMPSYDGLWLTRELMKKEAPPIVVAISSYNEYSLVREAFKLGAKDYILKDSLNEENLLNLLGKLVEKETVARKRQFKNSQYEKEAFLIGLLEKPMEVSNASRFKELKICLNPSNVTVCYILIDGFQELKERIGQDGMEDLKASIQAAIAQQLVGVQGEILVLGEHQYLLLLSIDASGDQEYRGRMDALLARIRYHLNHYVNIKVTMGVSSRGTDVALPELCQEAKGNAGLRFILGKNHSIYPWTSAQVTSGNKPESNWDIRGFLEALRMNSERETKAKLGKILGQIGKMPALPIGNIFYYYMELIFHMNQLIDESGYSVEDVFGQDFNFYEKIQRFETTEELNVWIGNLVSWVLAFFKERQSAGIRSQIERAKEFIRKNYDKDLSLKVVSDYVCLSENYFSSQFLKLAGTNFSEYLASVRMEWAKKYLEATDLKMYEICGRIGYANVEHFSRVFKKQFGVSPIKYRSEWEIHNKSQ